MKLVHIICFWLSLWLGLLILIQFPIIKFNTRRAVEAIEDGYLRHDLTEQETAKYQWFKGWILGNEKQYRYRLASARYLGLGVCFVLLVQSVISLRRESKRVSAEPAASPNDGPSTRLGNSGVTKGPPSVS
jgi:hypothetical protein